MTISGSDRAFGCEGRCLSSSSQSIDSVAKQTWRSSRRLMAVALQMTARQGSSNNIERRYPCFVGHRVRLAFMPSASEPSNIGCIRKSCVTKRRCTTGMSGMQQDKPSGWCGRHCSTGAPRLEKQDWSQDTSLGNTGVRNDHIMEEACWRVGFANTSDKRMPMMVLVARVRGCKSCGCIPSGDGSRMRWH